MYSKCLEFKKDFAHDLSLDFSWEPVEEKEKTEEVVELPLPAKRKRKKSDKILGAIVMIFAFFFE